MPGSRATRSPGTRVVTDGPTATTVPADSWPRTMGEVTTKEPMEPCCQKWTCAG